MVLYKLILTGSFLILLISLLFFLQGLAPSKWIINPARPIGDSRYGIRYSFTGAMSPAKKESAYLHRLSYSAGIIFHLGAFAGLFNLLLYVSGAGHPIWYKYILSMFLSTGVTGGLFILFKRFINRPLRSLSNPDDYISNILVTGFQFINLLSLWLPGMVPGLYLISSLLFVYLPVGKLRHSFYFFTSRIALGIFYGSRGVWIQQGGKDE